MMRIEFSHSDREPLAWSGDQPLTLGTASDNVLQLSGHGVAARHARLMHDRRGLVLEVLANAPHVYVNARPVRERALLRAGDMLGVGEHGLCLCGDGRDMGAAGQGVGHVTLRAVAGPRSGRAWTLRDRFDMDSAGNMAVAGRGVLAIEHGDAGLELTSNVPVRVNGNPVRQTSLRDGDQVMLGSHRFVVDAAGLVAGPDQVKPDPIPSAPTQTGDRRQMGWLVITAAALALGLAALLLIRF